MSDKGASSREDARVTSARKRVISDEVWNESVNEWVNGTLRSSAVPGATEVWNSLFSSLPELRKILEGKL